MQELIHVSNVTHSYMQSEYQKNHRNKLSVDISDVAKKHFMEEEELFQANKKILRK